MTVSASPGEAELIEAVCARIRERVDAQQAPLVEEFTREYYRWVPGDDLAQRSELDLYGAALSHWDFARTRRPGSAQLRVYDPRFDQHGWQSPHTVVEIVTDDMPFLVDSVTMELSRHDYGIHMVAHTVLGVRRDGGGRLQAVLTHGDPSPEALAESFLHFEIDRQSGDEALRRVHDRLERVLGEVRTAVGAWAAMRERMRTAGEQLTGREATVARDGAGADSPGRGDGGATAPVARAGDGTGRDRPGTGDHDGAAASRDEARALLHWLAADHYTFLGCREYAVSGDGDGGMQAVPGSGLGVLADGAAGDRIADEAFAKLPSSSAALLAGERPLTLTRADSRATVHRPSRYDYVGVRRYDESGAVVGEHRFLGLLTMAAYKADPAAVPLLRRKVGWVLERAAAPAGGHVEKALREILESFPREELFQIPEDQLFAIASGILALGERQQVRLFAWRDPYERYLSFLVFLPRDRFGTANRERIQELLREAFDAESVDFALRLTESVLVRIHFTVRTRAVAEPGPELTALERRIAEATRSWGDDLRDSLLESVGEERGAELVRRYRRAFPTAYRADWLARYAVSDIERIEALGESPGLDIFLYRPLEGGDGTLRAKLLRSGEHAALSELLPIFEHMGLDVLDERPYEVRPRDGRPVWIYDFGLRHHSELELSDGLRRRFTAAFGRVCAGKAEDDGFNALVLAAGLDWRDISLLRAIARYLRQLGIAFGDRHMEQTLTAHPGIARDLVELFRARFEPERAGREAVVEAVTERIERAIDGVEALDEDRILRSFHTVLGAVVRTSYFQPGPDGREKAHIALKLEPGRIALAPQPRPRYEIFVYAPDVEGVHLRGGEVARGGLRWSDRRGDFRTEVLGLMKAQMVKNALIVPVGAKGGFVVKRPPAERDALSAEVLRCYRIFIGGMLDVTDDITPGGTRAPAAVVRYDGDDPYLVVAADKGTAAFSDEANRIAVERGFWLGDAFASGGSAGYDHKQMGITARGAWESVRRHFREMGRDCQSEPFTVAGVGDMSGDVFGNGMLQSEQIELIAAFDHRHVFLDPRPDRAASFAERARLFALPRSSWADYDTSVISEGGGVWPRTAKSIPLPEPARAALGIEAESLTPAELVREILRAPVDLLYNGGIGTYVKASTESHADAGDKANDATRVDADELRCRVVGEGGNLGLTQPARIEYAAAGGRINTDAVDNVGGVNCSDREVNIKILLDAVAADGELTRKQRDALLELMTGDVAELVLADSRRQALALTLARSQAAEMLDVHHRLMRRMEALGRLDRALEHLPDGEALAERRAAGEGLTRPELAVVLAYAKIGLQRDLLDSDAPDDPHLERELVEYFPSPLPERFPRALAEHRLRREIIAMRVTNDMLDREGSTFAFRLGEDTGATPADVARAYVVAREAFAMPAFWADVEALDGRIETGVTVSMLADARRLVERSSRWLLRHRRRSLGIDGALAALAPGTMALAGLLPGVLAEEDRRAWDERARALGEAGVPGPLAERAASLPWLFSALDLTAVAETTGFALADVARVHLELAARLRMRWLHERIAALPRADRWQAMARAALRDDLFALHAALTAHVLGRPEEDEGAGARLERWLEAREPELDRCLTVLAEIRASAADEFTTLPVALRELRALLAGS